jgi:hypothetical protein
MLTAALLLPAVGAGIRGIAGLLRQVRAATDHIVELDRRERTGQVERQLVVLELSITPEEFLEIAKHPTVRRGIQDFELLRELGELDRCKTCDHLLTQQHPSTERSH